ncbi:hypothetical protein BT69DRAFT_1317522 [Atractiella rhizophila]|nr:hypothetical protein BT69DRAFT_1317522 [Atractiella rhizophila]
MASVSPPQSTSPSMASKIAPSSIGGLPARRISLVEDPLKGWQADEQKTATTQIKLFRSFAPSTPSSTHSSSLSDFRSPVLSPRSPASSSPPIRRDSQLATSSGRKTSFAFPFGPPSPGPSTSTGLLWGTSDEGGKDTQPKPSSGFGANSLFASPVMASPVSHSMLSPLSYSSHDDTHRARSPLVPASPNFSLGRRSSQGNEVAGYEEVAFQVLGDDELLPFKDRAGEVWDLLVVDPVNYDLWESLMNVVAENDGEEAYRGGRLPDARDSTQVPPADWGLRELMYHLKMSREECKDLEWIRALKDCVTEGGTTGESLWENLKGCLGVDLEWDEDEDPEEAVQSVTSPDGTEPPASAVEVVTNQGDLPFSIQVEEVHEGDSPARYSFSSNPGDSDFRLPPPTTEVSPRTLIKEINSSLPTFSPDEDSRSMKDLDPILEEGADPTSLTAHAGRGRRRHHERHISGGSKHMESIGEDTVLSEYGSDYEPISASISSLRDRPFEADDKYHPVYPIGAPRSKSRSSSVASGRSTDESRVMALRVTTLLNADEKKGEQEKHAMHQKEEEVAEEDRQGPKSGLAYSFSGVPFSPSLQPTLKEEEEGDGHQ